MNMIKKKFCSSNHEIIRLGDEIYKLIKSHGYDCHDSSVSLDRINHFVDGIVKDYRGGINHFADRIVKEYRGEIVNDGEISKDCYCDRCGNPK